MAKVFLNQVFKLHALLAFDKVFTSNFWKDLFKELDHLPKKWFQWISLAKWWYKNNLKMKPFKVLYGYNPPHLVFSAIVVTLVAAVEDYLKERDVMLDILKETLHKAQERMKFFNDKRRMDRVFEVGDRVYLKLQHYKQASVALRKNFKLSVKYYSPLTVLQKIGSLSYNLDLLASARIHLVFHVSQLKKHISQAHLPSLSLPIVDYAGQIIMQPGRILESRTVIRNGSGVLQLLI
ncbi:uncharacterized protein LOC113329863 [Papaver somniferum]|uniref:uncharacterized protein LOC113329863 n=1 Tax=Papaver somniferum TaxID=3469 RepID=UPI000E6F6A0E|nr:uncharacterized protein LOC113329863 [Papaver somniferum]